MSRHVYANLIHAYAEGAEIESWNGCKWIHDPSPCFLPELRYRIKPRSVKKSGWIIVCKNKKTYVTSNVYCCREEAEANMPICGVAVLPIEWVEEKHEHQR